MKLKNDEKRIEEKIPSTYLYIACTLHAFITSSVREIIRYCSSGTYRNGRSESC